ncbi:uncharacterized protein LOC113871938 [Abrus precatorius]|uniref:Uncharacterized protein LOC113871938 n=1 Tax=Abrus precatorius TaxID=3816 RepID=A0A8B8MAK0_ABRPR|nr:uncharacterized protein LOC113871938 [Abrus precatorius]
MASSSTNLTLKLLIDTKREKVLFAEASKEVIDFLFNLLRLPISSVIRLLNKNGMVGSLGNLYQSVENLNDTYMQPNQHKDLLLKPKAHFSSTKISALLSANDDDDDVDNLKASFYMLCGNQFSADVFPNESGFVKEVVTYMVMDDLVIYPMSTISSITLLNKFDVKEVGSLQEKVVELGMTQGVNLLKASLQSKMVLTSVFLKNNTGS